MEAVLLVCEKLDPVCLNMLLHVIALNKSPFAVRAFVRLVPTVDLSVSVETAWVS